MIMTFYCYSKKTDKNRKNIGYLIFGFTGVGPRRMYCRRSSPVQRSLYLPRPTVYCAGSLLSQLYLFIVMFKVNFPPSVLRTVFFAKYSMSFHFRVQGCCTSLGLGSLYLIGSTVAVPRRFYVPCTLLGLRSLNLVWSTVGGRLRSLYLVGSTAGGRLRLLYLAGSTVGGRLRSLYLVGSTVSGSLWSLYLVGSTVGGRLQSLLHFR